MHNNNSRTLSMKNPLIDVIGFTALILTLPIINWLLHQEVYFKAIGSYGAAAVVVWRAVVLARRAYKRWVDKRPLRVARRARERHEAMRQEMRRKLR